MIKEIKTMTIDETIRETMMTIRECSEYFLVQGEIGYFERKEFFESMLWHHLELEKIRASIKNSND